MTSIYMPMGHSTRKLRRDRTKQAERLKEINRDEMKPVLEEYHRRHDKHRQDVLIRFFELSVETQVSICLGNQRLSDCSLAITEGQDGAVGVLMHQHLREWLVGEESEKGVEILRKFADLLYDGMYDSVTSERWTLTIPDVAKEMGVKLTTPEQLKAKLEEEAGANAPVTLEQSHRFEDAARSEQGLPRLYRYSVKMKNGKYQYRATTNAADLATASFAEKLEKGKYQMPPVYPHGR